CRSACGSTGCLGFSFMAAWRESGCARTIARFSLYRMHWEGKSFAQGLSACDIHRCKEFDKSGHCMKTDDLEINRKVREMRSALDPLYREIEKIIVGQRVMIDRLLIGLLTGGHILVEGVPGLAKTLAIRTLAQGLQLAFHRIQFTP